MKRRGGTIKLCGMVDLARQMLKTVGLLRIFEVYDTREQALASFTEH
jgi:anti-anti-sigma regulatory factor